MKTFSFAVYERPRPRPRGMEVWNSCLAMMGRIAEGSRHCSGTTDFADPNIPRKKPGLLSFVVLFVVDG